MQRDDTDPAQQQGIRHALTAWAEGSHPSRRTAAHLAFAHLAARIDPDRLPSLLSGAVNEADLVWLIARWRGILDDGIHPVIIQQAFAAWMDTALTHLDTREPILAIFTDTVYRPNADATYVAPRYLTLSHLLYAWAPSRPDEAPTERDRLRDLLMNRGRQIDPAAPPLARHAPPL